jgi:hypothetical protein
MRLDQRKLDQIVGESYPEIIVEMIIDLLSSGPPFAINAYHKRMLLSLYKGIQKPMRNKVWNVYKERLNGAQLAGIRIGELEFMAKLFNKKIPTI